MRFVVVLALLAAACPKKDAPDAGPAPERAMDGITPVLEDKGAPDPRAVRICRALHGIVAERRAACCETAAASVVEGACTSVVSAALKTGNVTLDGQKLSACEAAQRDALEDCSWVRPLPPPAPKACELLLGGTLDEGARCRSSVECKAGLRCHGASPLDPGRCGKPRPANAPCGAAVDALAVGIAQTEIDAAHPECDGVCILGRCRARLAVGEACRSPIECGEANRCEGGACKAGRVAVGAACSGQGCVDGARCVDRKCVPLSAAGESCRSDFDCARGGCVDGRCGKKCGR